MSVCIAGVGGGELEEIFFLVGCRGGGGSLTECKWGL